MYIGLSEGVIESVDEVWPDCVLVTVRLTSPRSQGSEGSRASPGSSAPPVGRALAYPGLLNAPVAVGRRVLVNTTAVDLGLGSGGYHFLGAVLAADVVSEEADSARAAGCGAPTAGRGAQLAGHDRPPRPGHIMKLRYTPLQFATLAAEEPGGAAHQALKGFAGLEGTPVVCCELHSQVPAVAAGAAQVTGDRVRITYIMTDGGALPAAFSSLVRQMRAAGLVHRVITCGQAFGGDAEAVNIYSALATAFALGDADIIIVGMGPGIAGTGTPLGFSGIEQGQALNAAVSLGGLPVAVPRLSLADPRDRHYGMSHHTLAVLEKVCLAPCVLAMPLLAGEAEDAVHKRFKDGHRHLTLVDDGRPGLEYLTEAGIHPTTMGRGVREDPEFFLAAAAAGRVAGKLSGVISGHFAPAGVRV